MKKIIVHVWGGYSSSSRKIVDKHVIEDTVKKIIKSKENTIPIKLIASNSVGFWQQWKSMKLIKQAVNIPQECGLYLIGKSMGGAKTWAMLKRKWGYLKRFKHIEVLFVDAHGRIAFDGNRKPFGRRRDLSLISKWVVPIIHKQLSITNFFQRDYFPEGASFPALGDQKNTRIYVHRSETSSTYQEIDHWNITNDIVVKQNILDTLKFGFLK